MKNQNIRNKTLQFIGVNWTKILIVVTGALFSACQEPLDVEYKNIVEPVLVVEGKITTDTTSHFVILSQTVSLNEKELNWVSGAQVTISTNTGVIPLTEDEQKPGHYYTAPDVYGVIGETYQLHIELSNGDTYDATSYIPNISEIDSVKFIWQEASYGYYYHHLFFHGWELEEEGNAYLWNLRINDTLYNDTIWKTHFESDDFVNGRYIGVGPVVVYDTVAEKDTTVIGSNFPLYWLESNEIKTDTNFIEVEMESLPIEYFDFWLSLMQQTVWVGSPFDANKADLLSNISNGALGFFYGASIKRYSFVYIRPKNSIGWENPKQ
jgi:hypothetical protein